MGHRRGDGAVGVYSTSGSRHGTGDNPRSCPITSSNSQPRNATRSGGVGGVKELTAVGAEDVDLVDQLA